MIFFFWGGGIFSLFSVSVGSHSGGARTCKRSRRPRWAPAWKPHSPAPSWARARSHSHLRQRHLQDTGLTWHCGGGSARSNQILTCSCRLPRATRAQTGFSQTEALIGVGRGRLMVIATLNAGKVSCNFFFCFINNIITWLPMKLWNPRGQLWLAAHHY